MKETDIKIGTEIKYDENDNIIYFRDKDYEEWSEYDSNNRRIHYKSTDGDEEWWSYDDNGRLSSYRNNKGKRETWEHDENGKLIHLMISIGDNHFERWYTYDENDKRTTHTTPII